MTIAPISRAETPYKLRGFQKFGPGDQTAGSDPIPAEGWKRNGGREADDGDCDHRLH